MNGEEPVIEVELEDDVEEVPPFTPICTWSDDVDEHRRAFVISHMGNAGIEGKILVENMEAAFKWLRGDPLPQKKSNGTLRSIKPDKVE